jgi:16S rRNA (uracil1498-N3)-methyltransferase
MLEDPALVHQLARVLRVRQGDRIALCDGKGMDTICEITDTGRDTVHARMLERTRVWVPTRVLTVYLSLVRKERFEWALEKCTELGVSGVVPLETERTERGTVKHERAEAIMREAAEQCGRGDVPTFGDMVALRDIAFSGTFLACDHGGKDIARVVGGMSNAALLVGPEGGWTDAERTLFSEHAVPCVSLGPTTLRAETAAVAACARIMAV